jgi:DNA-binding NarL/FixJ family response regulator
LHSDSQVAVRVHRLIAETFLGEPPTPSHQVCHSNGQQTDNRVQNLRWGTAAENAHDREKHGNTPRGRRNGNVKLTADQVIAIKEHLASGRSQRSIAAEFAVSQGTISYINCGKWWKHV